MAAEPVAEKRKVWRAVVVMFFISCLLTASGALEFVCTTGTKLTRFFVAEVV
jgi:hypothetical protein